MNTTALERKFDVLNKNRNLSECAVNAFYLALKDLDDYALCSMNPYEIAEKYDCAPKELLDVFIHAARIGLLNFEWNMVCPFCGGIVHKKEYLKDLQGQDYHCVLCDVNHDVDLSGFVEVSFALTDEVKKLVVAPYSNYENFRKIFFSSSHRWTGAFHDFFYSHNFRNFQVLTSEDTLTLEIDAGTNELYRILSPDHHFLLILETSAKVSELPQIIDVDMTSEGFTPEKLEIPGGKIRISIKNHLPGRSAIMLLKINREESIRMLGAEPPTFSPFLAAKELLNNQTFRDLFKADHISRDLRLKMSNLTLLFTDLKNSTALYEEVGDVSAYSMVNDHFHELKASIGGHKGSIVKTIGDAVMASFSTPSDAMAAALDMQERISKLNRRYAEEGISEKNPISIKIGIHSGTAIVVTANEILDYFGQTVNTAARVQGLAGGDEIWITETMMADEVVTSALSQSGMTIEKQEAWLKGISTPVTVFACRKSE